MNRSSLPRHLRPSQILAMGAGAVHGFIRTENVSATQELRARVS
ncbi:hypothetical protein SAMN06296058_1977 [Pseudoxanthomonas indica]|uniref:Uncharacterized protein n=1 Tax=Pseudoxanthomonas indica TaxID=428993 RepID=A0A1T5KS65_9GAMM|nr:hypothetical protein SAMN06296058_1977 [Pseudoxanthomonas indica]